MKFSSTLIFPFLFLVFLTASCGTKQPFSFKYIPETNTTTFLNTYGYTYYLEIPGKWNYLGYDRTAKDYVFTDSLQRKLNIFGGGKGFSSFNKTNLNDSDFVRAFYKWDRDYILEQKPLANITLLEEKPGKYLICKFSVDSAGRGNCLYGIRKDLGIRFCTILSDSSSADIDPVLLKALYQSFR